MIIMRMCAGLGNQLFQYALGRHLAILNNTEFKMDTSIYATYKVDPINCAYGYGMDHFTIKASVATEEELKEFAFTRNKFFRKLLRFYSRPNTYFKRKYIFEPSRNGAKFDERLLKGKFKGNVYVEGYWQSSKYSEKILDILKEEFQVKEELEGLNKKMLEDINNCNAVSVHVRRGDIVIRQTGDDSLPEDYYRRAIEMIAKDHKNPVLYIFSDDPTWCKDNLKFDYPTVYVSQNGDDKNYEDLRLMYSCKHHVVGNSTFSLWGAMLGKNPQKKIITSKYLHGADVSGMDFYPESWTLI